MTRDESPEDWRGIDAKQEAAEEFIENPSRDTLHDALSELWLVQKTINNIDYFIDENYLADQTPEQIATTLDKARQSGDAEPVVELDGFGWATATEILNALAPDQFALLNRRSTETLEDLDYDVPHYKSANSDQYQEFCEAVKHAAKQYPLRREAEKLKGRPAPEGTPDYLIADLCFAHHYDADSDLDLTEVEVEFFLPIIDDPDLESEVRAAISESPLYKDTEDFLRSAIRNELNRL